MMAIAAMALEDAKQRLDKLLKKARAHSYKPIAIAEVLYQNRLSHIYDFSDIDTYRRRAYEHCREACDTLYNRKPVLNSRYWDQLFSQDVLPPPAMLALEKENELNPGRIESYIYAFVRDKVVAITAMADSVKAASPRAFSLRSFLAEFEANSRLIKSVDKLYEIIVYALFDAITSSLNAQVTLTVTPQGAILEDFKDFAELVLGVTPTRTTITQPAKLYRVGAANAADAGIDMWANFGPVVQVKHVTLKPNDVENIFEGIQADHVVIVCKRYEARVIELAINALGLEPKIRGVITEQQLVEWYDLACGAKYEETLGEVVLKSIYRQMEIEFPLSRKETIDEYLALRSYHPGLLVSPWVIDDLYPKPKPKRAPKQPKAVKPEPLAKPPKPSTRRKK